MSEIGYKEFQDDVNKIFSDHCKNYSLVINNGLLSKDEQSYICYLENPHIRIELNLVTNFPHIGVAWIFYYKITNDDFLKLDEHYLDNFINVDNSDVEQYYLDLKKLNIAENVSMRQSIQLELQYASKVIGLYSKFIDGTYSYDMYNQWLGYVKANCDLTNTNIKLPSYKEVFNK